jgi:hypothetical protein
MMAVLFILSAILGFFVWCLSTLVDDVTGITEMGLVVCVFFAVIILLIVLASILPYAVAEAVS